MTFTELIKALNYNGKTYILLHSKQIRLTLEKRAFPSVLHVSNVVSVDPARSLVDDTAVNDDKLDDEGMDGSFSLHRGPSSC